MARWIGWRKRSEHPRRRHSLLMLGAVLATMSLALFGGHGEANAATPIQHVVFIMQENRSFDQYFGTFPGADGIPMDQSGTPTVCVPDPSTGTCVKPFHDSADVNGGGPHDNLAAVIDLHGGRMDGFLQSKKAAADVMGFHDQRELPTYWSYASQFTLQDHMFGPARAWSLPEHQYLVSGWAAACSEPNKAESCTTNVRSTDLENVSAQPDYAWTDITYLLHKAGVSWKYYLADGSQPDCDDGQAKCCPQRQTIGTPEIWNPLVDFSTVHEDGQLGNIQETHDFFPAAAAGHLPAVSWVIPSQNISEHPPGAVSTGQDYVSRVINAVMKSPDWSSTAIFLSWDDWGGFYDHMVPPSVDSIGYGLRVPGLLISPWAKRGNIDHQVLSFDAYLKFIEDNWLDGQRIDPRTDGRPDPRPDVRETAPILGNLMKDFDFTRAPQPVVTGVNPSAARAGSTVTISGAGFTGATQVRFGTSAASAVTVTSDSALQAVVPPGSGTVDVSVSTSAGSSAAVPLDAFTYAPGAVVTAVGPSVGAEGTSVTISGAGFTGATAVDFGTAAASFTVASETSITAVVPPAPSQTSLTDVTVTTPAGVSPVGAGDRFTYPLIAVTRLQPARGRPAACAAVTILGYGFTGASAVSFGGTAAVSMVVVSDTQIMAQSPPGTGVVDVSVVSPQGTSARVPVDQYAYDPVIPEWRAPAVYPAGGTTHGRTSVSLSGSGFSGATSVMFGTAAAQFTVTDDRTIAAVSPRGTGTVDITVSGPGGTSAVSSLDHYTYGAIVPTVNRVSPSQGTGSGGTSVTITGTGFNGASLVTFGASEALTYTVVSDTEIIAISPPGAGTGDVQVSVLGVPSEPEQADHFTWQGPPSVSALLPSSGPSAGGMMVSISGTDFSGATTVFFGGLPAAWFTTISDTQIIAVSPAGAGVVDVTVQTLGGASAGTAENMYVYQ